MVADVRVEEMNKEPYKLSEEKRLGSLSEIIFQKRCLENDLIPSTVHGDESKYDFVTDYRGILNRVQVKCTATLDRKSSYGYRMCTSHGSKHKHRYTKEELSAFAMYIFPKDVWYIIPLEEITSKTVTLYPDTPNHRFCEFRENWNILKEEENGKANMLLP